MRKYSSLLLGILGLTACAAPVGNASPTDPHAKHVENFSSIRSSGPTNVLVNVGREQSVAVNCDESSTSQRIKTRVEGSTLIIESEWDGMKLWPLRPCTVNVSVPQLVAISARGSGEFVVRGYADGLASIANPGSGEVDVAALHTDKLDLEVSGAGDIKIRALHANDVQAALTGSGDVHAAGKAKTVHLRATGSGSIEAHELKAESCSVEGDGSGDIRLFASRRAAIQGTGSGDVTVLGHPADKQAQRRGSGTVRWE